MRYALKLAIDYDYAAPSDHLRNLLRLMPLNLPRRQQVQKSRLTLTPQPDERRDGRDFFGNATTSAVWHRPVAALTFELTAEVERFAAPTLLDLSPPISAVPAEMASEHSLGPEVPHHFLGASPRVSPFSEATSFARDLLTPDMTTFAAITTLGHALHRHMTFDNKATTVDTPAQDAFAQGRGVCQDFAHVMSAALRGIGIPAGYVSGFLRTFAPPGQPRLEGADAMHAWVRAWAGREMGWVEFDPTNDQLAGLDYIAVAFGRDYADVAPVHGALRSAGGAKTRQAVDVIPLER